MHNFISQHLRTISWSLTFFVIVVALLAWGSDEPFRNGFSAYALFPLFGLIAFSTMWSHYIAAALRHYVSQPRAILANYFEVTSLIALTAILLHPGILVWQLWQDGFGLPPESYLNYAGPDLSWAIALGSVSLLVFLFYELRRLFGRKNWWKFVQYASDLAMLAIFVHGLNLGDQLAPGQWFRWVWLFYGATYLIALFYGHSKSSSAKRG